jgi:hypothetical protein
VHLEVVAALIVGVGATVLGVVAVKQRSEHLRRVDDGHVVAHIVRGLSGQLPAEERQRDVSVRHVRVELLDGNIAEEHVSSRRAVLVLVLDQRPLEAGDLHVSDHVQWRDHRVVAGDEDLPLAVDREGDGLGVVADLRRHDEERIPRHAYSSRRDKPNRRRLGGGHQSTRGELGGDVRRLSACS